MEKMFSSGAQSIQRQSEINSDLISQINEEFIFAGFEATEDFLVMPLIKMGDQAWWDCNDSQWTVVLETPYEVDLKDQSDWERYLRFNYCKDIRDGKFFEYVFDQPQFTPVDGEP